MAEYGVALKASAEKELLRLKDHLLARIFETLESLALDPRPPGAKKLRGGKTLWRIRISDYRAIYSIDDVAKTVTVMRIAHRREVYE